MISTININKVLRSSKKEGENRINEEAGHICVKKRFFQSWEEFSYNRPKRKRGVAIQNT